MRHLLLLVCLLPAFATAQPRIAFTDNCGTPRCEQVAIGVEDLFKRAPSDSVRVVPLSQATYEVIFIGGWIDFSAGEDAISLVVVRHTERGLRQYVDSFVNGGPFSIDVFSTVCARELWRIIRAAS